MRVLIVEDDPILADGLAVGLGLSGFTADAVGTLADARAALGTDEFAGLVLDIMLPDGSGLTLLRELRASGSRLPILLLTARDRVADRVEGLDAGADDYLGKPFDLDELAARLRAMLRRQDGRAAAQISWNGLVLDPATFAGRHDGRDLRFSRREVALLQALLEHPGRILSKSSLEERLYGWQEEVESNTIEVHIHNLRAKLGRGFIQTVRGAGYRLAAG
ncbi:response regulator transcription factor [Cereibacter sphaeroides]|uniref:response regulator n=1 Tax=Cereibacter sphaeroides TaxID=1063 RepID=UPI001F21D430|nr:response regulator transcription factor [Cereibacter sphaeroides]MCE6959155.1 response regulator transcription factor [Cereibacter sphaeroides]MCE6968396.1 response regulator transcription factor [Cereibacter sphaeroides]MCE6974184.1 response regulator transcription factor [Cereibacter sphaeroides]